MKARLLLKQHVGEAAAPLVKLGDSVLRGMCIASPHGLGANIHASITGKVVHIDDNSIEIEGQPDSGYVKLDSASVNDNHIEIVKLAGIVGAGGAGFPTHVKLASAKAQGAIIANAAECEPILSHNIALLEQRPEVVLKGLDYARAMVKATSAYIAIKKKHTQAIISLNKALANYPDIKLRYLPDMYPAGDERVIIRELLGVELQPGELPTVANATVLNVETLKRICEAIDLKKPFIDKDISIGGRIKSHEQGKVYFDQPLGTPVIHYIDDCGGYIQPHGEIVLGGPFTGKHGEENAPITKTLGGIIVAMPFPQERSKVGLLVCESGADEQRLREIAKGMGAQVVAVEKCKRMKTVNGRDRCDLPGACPGQAEKIMIMRKKGMQAIIAGSCGD